MPLGSDSIVEVNPGFDREALSPRRVACSSLEFANLRRQVPLGLQIPLGRVMGPIDRYMLFGTNYSMLYEE